ncbi:ATP-dependent Clp protease proteolytic subunit [Streptomyces sp. NPDC050428]|uniref:ATP-dependent Clp protease proteolytic subunit n=1 Tax=Streptomyces sp. NPDC050428 TaxID=3155757 RepID=UPI0034133DEC
MEYRAEDGSRIVRLDGVVDDDLANSVVATLLLLSDAAPTADILLRIDSPGGSLAAGMAIYDTMQYVRSDVATCAVNLAAGMGQFLLSAGALGKRSAERDARIVMVGVQAGHAGEGDAADRARGKVAELAALHMGRDPEFVHAAWKAQPQREFGPEQARVYGLIDHVVDRAPGG